MKPGLVYWCNYCEKIVIENCGHFCYGGGYYLRNLTFGKAYQCENCDKIVVKNCGHCDYGDEEKEIKMYYQKY